MREFWNERYAAEAFIYGKLPNEFFKAQIALLEPGGLLVPADGEGRNGVYAATQGWEVTACDYSDEGKRKAELLAEEMGVTLDYRVVDLGEVIFAPNYFDCIALIFAHFAADKRAEYHRKLVRALKPGATLILEGFSKQQLGNASGGPKDIEMLFSVDLLREDFAGMSSLQIWSEDIELNESEHHSGPASVIRMVGVK